MIHDIYEAIIIPRLLSNILLVSGQYFKMETQSIKAVSLADRRVINACPGKRFPSIPMSQQREGLQVDHTGALVTHHLTDFLAPRRGITVGRTAQATGFCLAVAALVQPKACILQE